MAQLSIFDLLATIFTLALLHKTMTKQLFLLTCVFSTLLAGCTLPGASTPTSTVTTTPGATATLTLTPSETPTPLPTETPSITPTPSTMPTIQPVIGVLLNNTNIRAKPSKGGSERLGGLFYNQSVKVIGRNDRANWLWIVYPDAPGGTAWILASAIDLQGELGTLPIVIYPEGSDTPLALPPLLPLTTGQPLPVNPPASGAQTGTALQLLNVRVGPGLGYLSLGTIPGGTVLSMTGRVEDNSWFQFEYPSGLDGRAWISGDLVKLDDGPKKLPLFNFLATPFTEVPPQPEAPVATTDGETAAPPTETPIPPSATPDLPNGTVTAQINVRIGPAQSYDAVGMLNPNDRVVITGQTLSGLWFQIEYASGPDGRGWVAASYIKLNSDITKVPYFDNQGIPIPQP